MAQIRVRTPKDIGIMIRQHRKAQNLSQAELAKKAVVSRQWIVEVEQGKARAEIDGVFRLLRVLGVGVFVEMAQPVAPFEPYARRPTRASASRKQPIDINAIIDSSRKKKP